MCEVVVRNMEITRSSGGVNTPHQEFFFFWPELIVVIHGEYIPPGTYSVNLFEGRVARSLVSTRHRLEL